MKKLKKFKILISLFAMFSLFSLSRVNAMENNKNKNYVDVNKNKEFSVDLKDYEDYSNLDSNLMKFRNLLENIDFKDIYFDGKLNDLYCFYVKAWHYLRDNKLLEGYMFKDECFKRMELKGDSKFIFEIDKDDEETLKKLEDDSEDEFNMLNLIKQIISYYVKRKKEKSNNQEEKYNLQNSGIIDYEEKAEIFPSNYFNSEKINENYDNENYDNENYDNENYYNVNNNGEFSIAIKKYEDFHTSNNKLIKFRKLLEKIDFRNVEFNGTPFDLFVYYPVIFHNKGIKELCKDIILGSEYFEGMELKEDDSKFIFKINKDDKKSLNKLKSDSEDEFNTLNLIKQIISYYVKRKKAKSNNKEEIKNEEYFENEMSYNINYEKNENNEDCESSLKYYDKELYNEQYNKNLEENDEIQTFKNVSNIKKRDIDSINFGDYSDSKSKILTLGNEKNKIDEVEKYNKEDYLYSNNYKFKDFAFENLHKRFMFFINEMTEYSYNWYFKNCSDRFSYSVGVENFGSFSNSEYDLIKGLLKPLENENSYDENWMNKYKIRFNINNFLYDKTPKDMLKILSLVSQNKKLKEEYESFVKHIFENYLDSLINLELTDIIFKDEKKEFVEDDSKEKMLVKDLKRLFLDILDVKIEVDGLKLSFKKANPNYNKYVENINKIAGLIKSKNYSEEVWKEMSEKGKLIYNFFLTAKSFIMKENFLSIFLGYLILKQQIRTAEICHLDAKGLYEEYKEINTNSEFLDDNYITGINRTRISEIENFNEDDFLKFIEDEDGNKKEEKRKHLCEIFRENFDVLKKMLNNKSFEDDIKYYFPDGGKRYAKFFSYEKFKNLMEALINSGLEYFKKENVNKTYDGGFDLNDDENIDEKINECISFIKYFFNVYMKELIFNGPTKKYLEFIKNKFHYDDVNSLTKYMLKWYNEIFDIEIFSDGISFKFKLKDIDDYAITPFEIFTEVFNKYEGKEIDLEEFNYLLNMEDNEDEVEEYKKMFLYKVFYDIYKNAFAFKNSVNFWDSFIKNVLNRKK